jgi:NAD(P)-dependent dehydrogenase (short-subunit alcohol dehydrogenase family)
VLGGLDTPEGRAIPIAGIPIGRVSTPEDIGNAACYLASDEASMLTVSSIPSPQLLFADGAIGSLFRCRWG